MPEGIVVTFGKEMMDDHGGPVSFLRFFEQNMLRENVQWLHKCKNRPQLEKYINHVYISVAGRLYARCFYGGYETGLTRILTANNDQMKAIEWPRIILAGPIEKPGRKISLRGFQGFRYCTKLF